VAPSFGQKAHTRSASGGAWIPVKRALCNIPAFVDFWSPSAIELWAGFGPFQNRAPPIRGLLHRLPSRLSLRCSLFSGFHLRGRGTIILWSESLIYRQYAYSILAKVDYSLFPSYTKAFASLLIPLITMISASPEGTPGQFRPPSTTITTDIPSLIIPIQ
jgi:hypothetical protein